MTHRIDIPDDLGGGWVEVREKRSWADVKRIDGHALQWERTDEGTMAGTMNLLEQGIAKLEASVVTWSLTRGDGSPLPPNRGGFVSEDFDPELGDWLINALDEYYASRTRSKRGAPQAGAEATNGAAA